MRKVIALSVFSMLMLGCAADGSYNGPEIWNTNGKVVADPPVVIWRRSDGTDVLPPRDSKTEKDSESQ